MESHSYKVQVGTGTEVTWQEGIAIVTTTRMHTASGGWRFSRKVACKLRSEFQRTVKISWNKVKQELASTTTTTKGNCLIIVIQLSAQGGEQSQNYDMSFKI